MKTRWRQISPKYWIDDAAYVDCPCGRAGFRLRPEGKGQCSQCGRRFRMVTVVHVAPAAPADDALEGAGDRLTDRVRRDATPAPNPKAISRGEN
jgi:hypothetical protein